MGDKYTEVMSTAAAIAAAAAYLKQPASAGGLNIPPEVIDLLIAMAASSDNIDEDLDLVITALQNLSINVQGFPPNKSGIIAATVNCAIANQAYKGPDIPVPEGFLLVIKNHPWNPFGVIVRVASGAADATNNNASYPLLPNDTYEAQVQNMNQMHVSATVGGSLAVFSVEKMV